MVLGPTWWAAFSEMQIPRYHPRLAKTNLFCPPGHSPAWSIVINTDVAEAIVKRTHDGLLVVILSVEIIYSS